MQPDANQPQTQFGPPTTQPSQVPTPDNGDNKPKTSNSMRWVLIGIGGFFLLLVIVLLIAVATKGPKVDQTNTPTTSEEKPAATVDTTCTGGMQAYNNADLEIGFCYPPAWGNVSVQDAMYSADDTGTRLRLAFSAKPQVNLGLLTENWKTNAGREGVCNDPAQPLPDFKKFSASWQTNTQDGAVVYGLRGVEVLAKSYLIQEYTDSLQTNGTCLQGFTIINSRIYKHTSASYSASYNDTINTPKKYMDSPNSLIPSAERTDFAIFVKSVHNVQ